MTKISLISVIPSAEMAGTELSVLNSAVYFKERGIENQIWTLSTSDKFDKFCSLEGIVLKRFPIQFSKPFSSSFYLLRLVSQTFVYRKEFIFHFFLPKTYLLALLLRKLTKLKYVIGIRGKINYRGLVVEKMLKYALLNAETVICNARHLAPEIQLRFDLDVDKIECVSNMVRMRSRNQGEKFEAITAVVVSNFLEYKGHLLLLDALASLKFVPEVLFLGEGPLKSTIQNRIKDLGLEKKVSIYSLADVTNELSRSHFAIHPSATEGLSNAILEEISFGLPVIAFNVGGNSEIIKNDYNGFLLESRSKEALASAIHILSEKDEIRTILGKNAFESSKSFSPENYFQKVSRIYEGVLESLDYSHSDSKKKT